MDYGYDGSINQRVVNTYDADGNLIQRDYEDRQPGPITGTPNYIDTWTYNAGSVLSTTRDMDADGSLDTWTEYTYDADNFLIQMVGGGEADYADVYTYTLTNDANGYVVSYVWDSDTGADYRGAYTYTACE
jgi:hypothetical protein